MARLRTVHRCTECGGAAPRWSGRCGGCGEWNTLVEEAERVVAARATTQIGARPVPVAEVEMGAWASRPTGVGELDRVLGGGLVPGSVTLVGGEPGIGKSTLLLQALAAVARQGRPALLASAEESAQQVRLRAGRLGALDPHLWLVAETSLPAVVAAVDEVGPDVVVVDSIQAVADPEVGTAPGTVTQVRECASRLVALAKQRGTAVVLVGHVTKEGALAGPRVLEHVVDTVLAFEGERHHSLRLLRAVKHRFGPTGELGLFEMAGAGLDGVPDAGALFLADRQPGVPGSVVVPAMEGHRPLVVEVQALVTDTTLAVPRHSAQGLDARRLDLVVAVLTERAGIDLKKADVYASAVGGVRITEPAGDLALALAVASARRGRAVPADLVACGEVGLAGELRQVGSAPR
ncbi:MAG: DNA repair protein RadA, partial [Acidimicrobiales bacterium]